MPTLKDEPTKDQTEVGSKRGVCGHGSQGGGLVNLTDAAERSGKTRSIGCLIPDTSRIEWLFIVVEL